MRSVRSFVVLLAVLLVCSWVRGQVSPRVGRVAERYERAMALYRSERYAAAEEEFRVIAQLDEKKIGALQGESAFFSAVCAARLGRRDAAYELQRFIEFHPVSSRVDEARYELGSLYYNSKRYKSHARTYYYKYRDALL